MTARPDQAGPDMPAVLDATPLPAFLGALGEVAWCVDDEARCCWASPHWEQRTGMRASASRGLGWLDAIQGEDRSAMMAALMEARRQERFHVDLRLLRATEGRHRWHRVQAVRLRDGGGSEALHLCLASDVDELHRPHEQQVRAIAALQHRMRGTFGVIRSIIRRTARFAGSVEAFASSLDGRVGALARVQASVIRAPTAGVELGQLIGDELAACAGPEASSARLEGPRLRLRPRTAETLGLAVHELATNAVQHGALGSRQGLVRVTWSVQGDELAFEWRESGMPSPPNDAGRRGFGLDLLEGALAYELQAVIQLRFDAGGLCLHMRMPLDGNISTEAGEPPGPDTAR